MMIYKGVPPTQGEGGLSGTARFWEEYSCTSAPVQLMPKRVGADKGCEDIEDASLRETDSDRDQ